MPERATGSGEAASANSPPDLADFRAVYGAADGFTREVSEFCDEAAIPAMNEMRYAGHHLLRALGDDGSIVDMEQLRKAMSHCHRAQYEAAESGISFVLEKIRQFKEDYKSVVISECVKNYGDIIAAVRQAQKLLPGARSVEGPDGKGRFPDPAKYMEIFRDLREKWFMLENSREELAKIIRNNQREWRKFMIAISLTTIGILISGSVLAFAILRYFSE